MVELTRFQNRDMTKLSLFRAVSEVFLFLKQRSRTCVIKLFRKFKTRTKQTNAAKTLFSDNRQKCDLVIRKSLDGFLTTKNSIFFFIWPQNKKINDCSASKA